MKMRSLDFEYYNFILYLDSTNILFIISNQPDIYFILYLDSTNKVIFNLLDVADFILYFIWIVQIK